MFRPTICRTAFGPGLCDRPPEGNRMKEVNVAGGLSGLIALFAAVDKSIRIFSGERRFVTSPSEPIKGRRWFLMVSETTMGPERIAMPGPGRANLPTQAKAPLPNKKGSETNTAAANTQST